MAEKKVIWITGASSGIGKALAIKFAENGWIVAASARRENLLKELQNINQNIYPYPLDVTDIEKCKSTAKSIIDNLNGIDICVFGTGMHDPKSEKQFNLDKIRDIMEVNYLGFHRHKLHHILFLHILALMLQHHPMVACFSVNRLLF